MNIDIKLLQNRMKALQAEHRKGSQQLMRLQQQETDIRQTLLRIEGAIRVLEELLNPAQAEPSVTDETPIAAVQ
jgi:hypothetical protein